MLAPIPCHIQPDSMYIPIIPAEDNLVCISDTLCDIMLFQPKYFEQNIPGSTNKIYVRKTIANMLLEVAQSLPHGYKLKIYDAWRPYAVQKALFDDYYHRLAQLPENQDKSTAELIEETMRFVSFPSEDPDQPFVHSTGGAVDLTLVDADGNELNMGTTFDDFTEAANTAYFENSSNYEVRNNRRILYNAMLSAGFTNYPAEWWHYDFGDRFWAATKLTNSIYQGIYTLHNSM